jgi:hypothetical protein
MTVPWAADIDTDDPHIEVCLRWVPSGRQVVVGRTSTLRAAGSASAFLTELAELLHAMAVEYDAGARRMDNDAAAAASGTPSDM